MSPLTVIRHSFTSPLRYPGGKLPIANYIKTILEQNDLTDGAYVEPFGGGAAVAWSLLFEEFVSQVYVNDLNPFVYAFWESVLHKTDKLCSRISSTRVSMAEWRRQKDIYEHPSSHSQLDLGFCAFFLNRTNRSGIISGGVIGGKFQDGPWKLSVRYNKSDLIARIQRIARYSSRINLTKLDGRDFIRKVLPKIDGRLLVYYDPPYYGKGKELYQNFLEHDDHSEISDLIQKQRSLNWIVSYDATPEILGLYRNRRKILYDLSYSAQSQYKGKEVMFFSDNLILPNLSHPVISNREMYSRN